MGDAESWVREALAERQADHGLRPPCLPRRGSALAPAQADGAGARRAEHRGRRGARGGCARGLQERSPERVLATNVEYYSAVVLDVAEIPPPLAPAMFACSRVAGWSAHILEQKRTGRLFRPSARYMGRRRARSSRWVDPGRGGAGARRPEPRLAEGGRRAPGRSPTLADAVGRRAAREVAARSADYRERARLPGDRAVPLPPEDRAAAPRARGREPGLPRLGARLARAALARPPRRRQRASARCCTRWRTHDPNQAVRRLAIVCLKNGSPQPRHDPA